MPDGSDTGTSLTDETGYTLTGLKRDGTYDIQLVGGIDGTDADSDLDYFTNRSTDTATALEVPASLRAVPGTAPGTIAVTWNQQVVATTSQTRFRVRWKLKSTAAWTGVTWTAVADSDSDGQTHDETTYTITGLLASNEEYDIEVGFFWNSTIGWQDAIPTSAFAAAIPAPTGLTATPSTTLGQINVTWDQQRYSAASNAKLQVRVTWSTGGTWITWQDVSDGADPGSFTHDEIAHTVSGLVVGRPHDVQVRIVVGSTGGTVAQVDDVKAGFHPQGMRATTGDTPGTIDVTWTQQTVYSEAWRRFHISPRLSSASAWQSWINIADETASSHQLTGLTAGELYDVRMMFNRNSEHDWPDQNFLPMLTGIRAGFVQAPTNLRVVPSTTAAGALDLSWDQQTASTDGMSKFQYRTRLSSATDWTGVTWQDIGDGGDDGSHAYDESSATISGLQQGVSYDIELRFHWNSTHGESEAASAMAVSASVPSPPSFRAEAGATSGAAVLTWDAMQGIDSLQYRYRATGAASYGSWTNVTDSNSNSNTGDETAQTITGLTPGTDYDFQVQALVSATPSTPASDSAKAQRHSVPTNFAVAVGSNPGELDLTWGTPAAGTTVAGFQYRHKRSDQPESAYTTWAAVPDSGSNGRADERAYTITSLWAGVSHDVQISTEAGTTRSVPNSATTATATPTPVAAPTVLTGARGGSARRHRPHLDRSRIRHAAVRRLYRALPVPRKARVQCHMGRVDRHPGGECGVLHRHCPERVRTVRHRAARRHRRRHRGHRHDRRVPQRRGIRHGHPLRHRQSGRLYRGGRHQPGRPEPELDGADDVRRRIHRREVPDTLQGDISGVAGYHAVRMGRHHRKQPRVIIAHSHRSRHPAVRHRAALPAQQLADIRRRRGAGNPGTRASTVRAVGDHQPGHAPG